MKTFVMGVLGANARCCLGGEKCGSLLTFTVSSAESEEREAGCESGSERDGDIGVGIRMGYARNEVDSYVGDRICIE